MLQTRIALSLAACLAVTLSAFAEEPPCATNYHATAQSSETFVLTTLAPATVIERLPRKLAAAGASMKTSEPAKGRLEAEGLDVKAEVSGSATRVKFVSSTAAGKATLCRYASLVGDVPQPPKPAVPQDAALIAQMKEDLIRKHQIIQNDTSNGLDWAKFTTTADFLEFAITDIKNTADGKREYGISMLLPRTSCGIAREDVADASESLLGKNFEVRTKPVRVDAALVYTNEAGAWRLNAAEITRMESTK
jgi:hypothetical protein